MYTVGKGITFKFAGSTYSTCVVQDKFFNLLLPPSLYIVNRVKGLSGKAISSTSAAAYAQRLCTYFNVLHNPNNELGNLDWKNVTDEQMAFYLTAYLQSERGLKDRSLSAHVATLSNFYNWAYDSGFLSHYPSYSFTIKKGLRTVNLLQRPKSVDPFDLSLKYIDQKTFANLLRYITAQNPFCVERDEIILHLGYECSFRAFETVHPANLQLDKLKKAVVEAREKGKQTLDIVVYGKGNKLRPSTIGPILFQKIENFIFGRRKLVPGNNLICKEDGTLLATKHPTKMMTRAVHNSNDPKLSGRTFHCLRHSYATNLVAWCMELKPGTDRSNADPMVIVPERMGHSDFKTTLIYIHFDALMNHRSDYLKEQNLDGHPAFKDVIKLEHH